MSKRKKGAVGTSKYDMDINGQPRTVTNTLTQPPLLTLFETTSKTTDGSGFERTVTEMRGQSEMTQSDTLPAKMGYGDEEKKVRKILEAAGAKFGDLVKDDPMFRYVTLPPGWKKVRTENAYWSDLVDNKGSKRGSIFYKASPWDREAFMRLGARYFIDLEYPEDSKARAIVRDRGEGDKAIFTTPWRQTSEPAREEAAKWLKELFPDWQDFAAYW